jgi:hypothetical protein
MVIRAEVPSTATTRTVYVGDRRRRPSDTLRDSSQAPKDRPVILLRGCHPVSLVAAGANALRPISWKLEQLTGPVAIGANLLPKGSTAATLLTNLRGLFAVRATQRSADDKHEDVVSWHVLFADVEVTSATHTDNQNVLLEMKDEYVTVQGGVSYAIRARIQHVEGVVGASLAALQVSTIQNWVDVGARSRGCYSVGEKPPTLDLLEPIPPGGGPYNDGDEGHPDTFPFDSCVEVTREGPAVTIETDDVPGSSFPTFLSMDGLRILKRAEVSSPKYAQCCKGLHGVTHFVTAVAARSADAPNSFVVYKLLRWRLSATAVFSVIRERLILGEPRPAIDALHVGEQTLSPPVDASEAGVEIYGPEATGEWADRQVPTLNDYERQQHPAAARAATS